MLELIVWFVVSVSGLTKAATQPVEPAPALQVCGEAGGSADPDGRCLPIPPPHT